ncbi:MAG: hypothetical protein Q8T09_01125, partial [Candidatus Melainabacteria bacterium]|nr:hypothetical protein [Candidatus Melainabacteria bacterium]
PQSRTQRYCMRCHLSSTIRSVVLAAEIILLCPETPLPGCLMWAGKFLFLLLLHIVFQDSKKSVASFAAIVQIF